jgi:hypothetical protein
MVQLTWYLAVYFGGRGVRVNCISPGGLYSTNMPAAFAARYRARTPLGQMAGPNDIKGAALFLAADASAYVAGQNLLIDGRFALIQRSGRRNGVDHSGRRQCRHWHRTHHALPCPRTGLARRRWPGVIFDRNHQRMAAAL